MTYGTPWWLPPLLLVLAALVQASLLPAVGLVAVRPNLVLQIVVIWAVLRGVREALPWALTGGVVLDTFSGAPFGTATLPLLVTAFCSSAGEISIFRSNLLLPLAVVFWGSLLYDALYLFLLATHQLPVSWLQTLRHIVVPGAILNMILAPLAYLVVSRIERRTRRAKYDTVEW